MFIAVAGLNAQSPIVEQAIEQVSETNLHHHLDSLCWADGYQSRITFTPGNDYAAGYIARYFESLPYVTRVIRDTFNISVANTPYNTYPQVNIIAEIDGYDPDAGLIILGGHYDASGSRHGNAYYAANWSTMPIQGADDNASGIAALLEISRIISEQSAQISHRHTLRFIALAAEEYHPNHVDDHHLGSLYDAANLYNAQTPLTAVVILDMIAFNPLNNYIEIISNTQSLWLADSVAVMAQLYVPGLQTNSRPFPDVPYSDHESYQYYGFPSILLMENDRPWANDLPYYQLNPNYHTTADSIGTLRMSQLTKVTQVALASALHLSGSGGISTISGNRSASTSISELSVFPNPFNAYTNISFSVSTTARISAKIYDIRGSHVKTFRNAYSSSSTFRYSWNGTDDLNQPVGSGTYFLVVNADSEVFIKKVVLLK
jgi:hypothetical protein